jgi:hypothetical protein
MLSVAIQSLSDAEMTNWLSKVLGHTGITDVTVLMGFYTAVSLTVGFYECASSAPGMKI